MTPSRSSRRPRSARSASPAPACTLAAAITAELAKGATPLEASRTAKKVVVSAIEHRMHGNAPFDCAYQGYYQG